MNTEQWILLLLLGGILGMLGQGIRVITGLKKLHNNSSREHLAFGDIFQFRTLLLSLIIGFIAGALTIIVMMPEGGAAAKVERQTILTLLAAGYAGTDFIEAFIKKYLPSESGHKPVDRVDTTPAIG